MVAGDAAAGQRLDHFLCGALRLASRARARRLVEAGVVRVNGRLASAGQRLMPGDAIVVDEVHPEVALPDPALALAVCYEDAWLVVADKPPGMPSHPLRPGERGTLASALLARYPEMNGVGYSPREPGLVHRLDTDTSGVLLAARDAETFRSLRSQLEAGEIDKRYLALCAGRPTVPAVHEAWLSARGRRVTVRSAQFREALPVRIELLGAEPCGPSQTLLEIRAPHARRHQIRAQLAALGHPIAGDALYGPNLLAGLSHHFLHASELHLSHPHTGAALHVRADLPARSRALLTALRAT